VLTAGLAACALLSIAVAADITAERAPVLNGVNAFGPGERLTYVLKWEFIHAGTATLAVLPDEIAGGRPVRHFRLTAETNRVLDKIYKVRDRIDAYTDLALNHSVLYRKIQREGRHERDVVVRFDWENQTAVYTNFGNPRDPVSLMPGAFDPLSAFYFVRAADLNINQVIERPVTDGKTCVKGRVAVLAREVIRVNGKDYDTYRISPDIKHVGGVFEKSKNARIELWISADHRHIPVRIKSRVAVGSFVGELVSDAGDARVDPPRE